MHAFKKRLSDEIGSAWYRAMEANLKDVADGTVRIALTLSPKGKIKRLRVLSNTSNKLFERVSLAAIREAKIPPIPHELLMNEEYYDELLFTIYPDGNGPKSQSSGENRPNQAMQPTASPRTASGSHD
jgi:TonB family protein